MYLSQIANCICLKSEYYQLSRDPQVAGSQVLTVRKNWVNIGFLERGQNYDSTHVSRFV